MHVIVSLVVRVFEHLIVFAAPQRERDRPGLRPGSGILDRQLVVQRVRCREREAFGDM
jgi:hypothetical protein